MTSHLPIFSSKLTNKQRNNKLLWHSANVASGLHSSSSAEIQVKGQSSYKVFNCCLRHEQDATLGLGQRERQFVARSMVVVLLYTE